jgi:hypothetical protein
LTMIWSCSFGIIFNSCSAGIGAEISAQRSTTRSNAPETAAGERAASPGMTAYSATVVTTLETGRWLKVGNLASFSICSSYCGNVCTGALERIATTL